MISYFMLIYIGSPEGVTLLEFKEEAEDNQETPQTIAPEGEKLATLFLEGKPQSILSRLCFYKYHLSPFMFDALGYKSWLETLDA